MIQVIPSGSPLRYAVRVLRSLFALHRRVAWLAALAGVVSAASAHAGGALELRLVGIMHESLSALTRVQEGVVREDFAAILEGARHLESNAQTLRGFDLGALGMDAGRDAEFDRFLDLGVKSARSMAAAARRRDLDAVIRGSRQMLADSCLPCHDGFRAITEVRTPRVLFMRTLLSSVQNIHRGIAFADFARVAREAREIGAVAHVFAWTRVVDALFEVSDPAEQARFRSYLEELSSRAIQVESAAIARSAEGVVAATSAMMADGCVACHREFRKAHSGD